MTSIGKLSTTSILKDATAGLTVFLVALPLCLGVALASNAPLLSGVLSGIVGGILVGAISRSHTSVSGASPGLAAVVATQIDALGFSTFLMALVIAGLLQSLLGVLRAGIIAEFIPSSVIKGLLAAIGILLILKQSPHLLGHDADPEGDMAFLQPNNSNTLSELVNTFNHIHLGAAAIGLASIALMVLWARVKPLNKLAIPPQLGVVVLGVGLGAIFQRLGGAWRIEASNFVNVPVAHGLSELTGFLQTPDFSQWNHPAVYVAALTIAAVTSLESLLNLEAIDKLDPQQRTSPPSWELVAQGLGNVAVGFIGGIPVTSVIVRGSVNVNAGARTKLATIIHGTLLLLSVALVPQWLNRIPLSCLAAILLVTGFKLASPKLVRQMWEGGKYQFVPFVVTVAAIVFTDLLIGVLAGLVVSIAFLLYRNARTPLFRVREKHLGGEVLHIDLPNQVSFLNRAVLKKALGTVPPKGHVMLDAQNTVYIDPDVLDLIQDYRQKTAVAREQSVSLIGFQRRYQLEDRVEYVDYSTRDIQQTMTPGQVLEVLQDGHARFCSGRRLTRNLGRQVQATAAAQHPLAVVLSCIDSRTPTELLFDLGVGDVFTIRIAGNVLTTEVVGSMEYACSVAGAKLILVMGHTRCGAIGASIESAASNLTTASLPQCQHLAPVIDKIRSSIRVVDALRTSDSSLADAEMFATAVAVENVRRTSIEIFERSKSLRILHEQSQVAVAGAIYDVATGRITFL